MAECSDGCDRAAQDAEGLVCVTKAFPTWLQKGTGRNPLTGLDGTCKNRDRSLHACKIIMKDFQNTNVPLLKPAPFLQMQPSPLAPESHEFNPKKACVFASWE